MPFLARYVEAMSSRTQKGAGETAAGCLLALMGSGVAWFFLARIMGFWISGLLTVFAVLPLLTIMAMLWVGSMSKPKNAAEERQKQAQEAIAYMNGALQKGRRATLGRVRPPLGSGPRFAERVHVGG
jgi:ABC-type multidrug transport system fused ATPase/permease subunit